MASKWNLRLVATILFSAGSACAEEVTPQLGVISIDRQSADFRDLIARSEREEARVADRKLGAVDDRADLANEEAFLLALADRAEADALQRAMSRDGDAPEGFFAAINLAALPDAVPGAARIRTLAKARDEAALVIDSTVRSSGPQRSFTTHYRDMHAILSCYWTYNEQLEFLYGGDSALARESELEESYRRERFGADRAAVSTEWDSQAPPAARNAETQEGFSGIGKNFTIAGVPCEMIYDCDNGGVPCSRDVLHTLVEHVELIRTGDM